MEWTIRLEAKTGSGDVTTFDVGTLRRAVGDLSADGVGLSLAEAKALLAELQQRIVQSQVNEYVAIVRGVEKTWAAVADRDTLPPLGAGW